MPMPPLDDEDNLEPEPNGSFAKGMLWSLVISGTLWLSLFG